MRAFKFLAAGAVAPFTGRAWPTPSTQGPGAWVVSPQADLARYGVHACRPEHLAYWPDEELWLVEIGGTVVEGPFEIAAAQGRLLARVTGWDAHAAREYANACAWRACDVTADALGQAGMRAERDSLRACLDLATLEATARTLSGDASPGDARGLAAYAAGAAFRARQGRYREAALQCAHLGAAVARSDAGAEGERAWQSEWLVRRLHLRELVARSAFADVAI